VCSFGSLALENSEDTGTNKNSNILQIKKKIKMCPLPALFLEDLIPSTFHLWYTGWFISEFRSDPIPHHSVN
jgi:hypothetical protein